MKILIACQIDPAARRELAESHELASVPGDGAEFRARLPESDALVVRSGVAITRERIAEATRLKLLVRAGSGMDQIDLAALESRSIALERIPEPSARSVAELGLALMLALSRKLLEADRSVRSGAWDKAGLVGSELAGKTLGVVGLGTTGLCMARLGASVGMRVAGCVAHPTPERARSLRDEGIALQGFDEVARSADVLSLHLPLSDATRNLVDASVLDRMRPGALLVNLSRGGIVDEAALAEALERSPGLGGAALDVHAREGAGQASPLAACENAILTPHIGAQTEEAHREIGRRIVEIFQNFSERLAE